MKRCSSIFIALLVTLAACDEPVGPQPPTPIKAPEGYVPGGDPMLPPSPPPPPVPKAAEAQPAGDGGAALAAAAPAEPPAPAPTGPKCPADIATALTGKAKWVTKDKKKHLEVRLTAKSADLGVGFHQPVKVEGATLDDAQVGAELVALLTPESPKAKVKLSAPVSCGADDNQLQATVDAKGLSVALKEVPKPPEPGYLNVMAEAGLKVSAGGKELGLTPLKNVPLAPGKYQVTAKPAKGKARTAVAEIKSGETATVTMKK